MNPLFSAVTRISCFRHGEGGAAMGDALISMADIAPRALSQQPSPALRARSQGLNFRKGRRGTRHAHL